MKYPPVTQALCTGSDNKGGRQKAQEWWHDSPQALMIKEQPEQVHQRSGEDSS